MLQSPSRAIFYNKYQTVKHPKVEPQPAPIEYIIFSFIPDNAILETLNDHKRLIINEHINILYNILFAMNTVLMATKPI